jgi:mRNA interferase RelE/StbE
MNMRRHPPFCSSQPLRNPELAIVFSPEAVEDFKDLSAYDKASVGDAIQRHLVNNPMHESKAKIKKLRGLEKPQYRLRIDEIRLFYDVVENRVDVLGIVEKKNASDWLEKEGVKE